MLVFTVSRRIKNNNKKRKLENEQYFTKVSNNGNANENVSEEPHDIMSELDWTGMGGDNISDFKIQRHDVNENVA